MFFMLWVASIIATIVIAVEKRLNVVGYFFLALFLGPLAVLIILLSRTKVDEVTEMEGVFTLQDAKRHLLGMKRNIKYLQEKAEMLETKINKLSSDEPEVVRESKAVAASKKALERKVTRVPKPEGFEQVFGKYWLNRIGVVLFVIGIGLFISYTFQYLNAFAKVSIGYIFSAAFFAWGNYLEKNKKYIKIAWGILGGAWGLLYLSTYAMHYIEATRVISSSIIEIVLLAIVCGAAVYYNLKYESWIVTALTFVLAFITAGLGGMDYSSVIYFSLLAGSIAFLSYKRKWIPFLILGIVGTYITHVCWIRPEFFFHAMNVPTGISLRVYQFQIMFSILAMSWAIYSIVFFLLRQKKEEDRNLLITGKLLNAGFFIFLGLYEIDRIQSTLNGTGDEKFWFLTVLAGIYLLFSYIFKRLKNRKYIVVNSTIAFTLIALAIFIKVPKLSVAFYWILEMTMLFVLGVYYKEWTYRVFAGMMSIFIMIRLFFVDFYSTATYAIANMEWRHDILIFSFAALCFYAFGIVVDKNKLGKGLAKDERDLYSWAFPVFGTVLLTFLLESEMASRWLSLSWTMLGACLLAAGLFLSNRVFRLNALCVLSLAALRVITVDMSGVNTVYKIAAFTVLGALLLGISMIYSKYKVKN